MCFERFFIFLSYFLGISVRILGNLDRFERFFKIWMILFFLKNVYFNGVWTFLGWFLNEILMLRFFENFKRSLSDFFLTAPFWFFGCFSFFHIWISLIFSLFSGFFFFLRFFSDERLFFLLCVSDYSCRRHNGIMNPAVKRHPLQCLALTGHIINTAWCDIEIGSRYMPDFLHTSPL